MRMMATMARSSLLGLIIIDHLSLLIKQYSARSSQYHLLVTVIACGQFMDSSSSIQYYLTAGISTDRTNRDSHQLQIVNENRGQEITCRKL